MIVNLITSYMKELPLPAVVSFISATTNSLTFNISHTNNYTVKAFYEIGNSNPSTTSINISPNSNENITITGLNSSTTYTLFVLLEDLIYNLRSTSSSSNGNTTGSLFDFTSNIFTNAGATGRNGPTLSQCQSTYSSQSWSSNTSFFNVTTQGYQEWTVPETKVYRITVAGARGGGTSGYSGGNGATMRGDFSLTQGEKIIMVVGQMGNDRSTTCGGGFGGGGSFVTKGSSYTNSTLLIAAAGGSGAGHGSGGNGNPGLTTQTAGTSSQSPAGAAGSGGNGGGIPSNGCSSSEGSGGGGFIGNGTNGNGADSTSGGRSFRNGAIGGSGGGGFGGGGGSNGNAYGASGGGGYSGGGAGGLMSQCTCSAMGNAGGGGSYNDGSNQSNTQGNNSSHGYITIQKL
jgi:hypothetical protein